MAGTGSGVEFQIDCAPASSLRAWLTVEDPAATAALLKLHTTTERSVTYQDGDATVHFSYNYAATGPDDRWIESRIGQRPRHVRVKPTTAQRLAAAGSRVHHRFGQGSMVEVPQKTGAQVLDALAQAARPKSAGIGGISSGGGGGGRDTSGTLSPWPLDQTFGEWLATQARAEPEVMVTCRAESGARRRQSKSGQKEAWRLWLRGESDPERGGLPPVAEEEARLEAERAAAAAAAAAAAEEEAAAKRAVAEAALRRTMSAVGFTIPESGGVPPPPRPTKHSRSMAVLRRSFSTRATTAMEHVCVCSTSPLAGLARSVGMSPLRQAP